MDTALRFSGRHGRWLLRAGHFADPAELVASVDYLAVS